MNYFNGNVRKIGFLFFTLALVAFLVKLGFWQISRGIEKERLLEHFAQGELIIYSDLIELPENAKGLTVSLKGDFDASKSVLLDNQTYKGKVGYRWMMPFLPEKQSFQKNKWILVDMGWISAFERRETLPSLPLLSGRYSIEGVLDFPSLKMVLKNENSMLSWPLRVQLVDLNNIAKMAKKDFFPWVLRLQSGPFQEGEVVHLDTTPIWKPVVLLPEKHFAYAVQWFGLAFVLLIGSWILWKKERI